MGDTKEADCYLPFWRMRPRIEGIVLETYDDLIKLGNLPKAVNASMGNTPLYFRAPAFKISPSLFLRWSRQMTVSQHAGRCSEMLPETPCHPVTLEPDEAVESIIITLTHLVADKRRLLSAFADIRITPAESVLEYHPFLLRGNELVHSDLGLSMDKNALAFGVGL
jgi:hypothetical protein